jgi:hypothetical protein
LSSFSAAEKATDTAAAAAEEVSEISKFKLNDPSVAAILNSDSNLFLKASISD